MKHYAVLFTAGAERDMEALYDYVAEYDSPASAEALLDKILHVVESLATHPERGTYPRELQSLGIREYRQLFFNPYRVIYRVINRQVIIYLIADGRRDMTSMLSMRLMSNQ